MDPVLIRGADKLKQLAWTVTPAFCYADCRSLVERATERFFGRNTKEVLAGVAACELIEIRPGLNGLPPHFHKRSESVIVFLDEPLPDGFDMVVDQLRGRRVLWVPVAGLRCRTHHIPPGLVHGFRPYPGQNGVLRFFAVSGEPVDESDTYYFYDER